MADTFADRYSLEPWSGWSINQRDWWVPEVLWAWRQTSNYQRVVPLRVNFAAVATKKMTWTGLYHLEPNYNSVPDTSLWLEKMYPAGWYQEMTLNTYAGGMGLSAAPSVTKALMQKLSLITGKAQAWVTRGKQALSRAAAETKRESTLRGDAIVRTLAYAAG